MRILYVNIISESFFLFTLMFVGPIEDEMAKTAERINSIEYLEGFKSIIEEGGFI